MKHLPMIATSLFLFGCGMNVHERRIENGVLVSETEGRVGYRSSEITASTYAPAMKTCQAEIGGMDGREEHAICQKRVRADERRRNDQLDIQAYPYYYGR